MEFQPAGRSEMLWLSPKCVLESGKPIRGGIPLCLPWFGPGADGKTMHGFARTQEWSLVEAQTKESGATRLAFELSGDACTCALWQHAFVFRLDVLVGQELCLTITAINHSGTEAPLAFAFHTYFAVPDVSQANVTGLEGTAFIDKMDNLTRKTQQAEVVISAVTDRIYFDVPTQQTLRTSTAHFSVESDAPCAVVWNAWTNDKNMPDLGKGNHVGYICIERGDVSGRAAFLQPGEKYQRWMTLSYRE
jgi:D-hexose-6-phosphate mutarotase